jgi:hypothetical protein
MVLVEASLSSSTSARADSPANKSGAEGQAAGEHGERREFGEFERGGEDAAALQTTRGLRWCGRDQARDRRDSRHRSGDEMICCNAARLLYEAPAPAAALL